MSKGRYVTQVALMAVLLFLVVMASLRYGARTVPSEAVLNALMSKGETTMNQLVVMERIPRTLFGLLAGAALGLSGMLMQSVTRNPIADPSILGVNTGASLAVVIGIAYFKISTPILYILYAIVGASLACLLVYVMGSTGSGKATPIKLALSGAAVSAALSSMVSLVILPRTDVMNAFRFWQVGSISGASMEGIAIIGPLLLIGAVLALVMAPGLDAIALGDALATGLGANTGLIRGISIVAGVLLCAGVTALAGPIGFVGLMVPHGVRMIVGPGFRKMIPVVCLTGASLLLGADVIGRIIGRPSELEVGIVTAFIGAPVLIGIAMKARVKV